MECFGYLKDILYGKASQPNYDGIYLRGPAALRHFTYRAVNAIKSVFSENGSNVFSKSQSQHNQSQQNRYSRNYVGTKYEQRKRNNYLDNHNECEQAQYQRRVQLRQGSGSVRTEGNRGRKYQSVDEQQIGSTIYTIPVKNRFPENF